MTRKLTIATVAFFCLLGGLAYSAGTADARVRDGQKCATPTTLKSTWRMLPDGCVYVTPYGGSTQLPKAATEVDVWVDGKRLRQRGDVFMTRPLGNEIIPIIALSRVNLHGGGPVLVNGYFRVVRVYWWAS